MTVFFILLVREREIWEIYERDSGNWSSPTPPPPPLSPSCHFVDETTFYACDMGLDSWIKRLEYDSFLAIEWFENNNMKLNQDKCRFLVSGYENEYVWANIRNAKIWESSK